MAKEINKSLEGLEEIQKKIDELRSAELSQIDEIKKGFIDSVIVFIDLVDSTEYKILHSSTPQKWILRQKQFLEIVAKYVEKTNGKVVKYIGDEIMAFYEGKSAILDSLNLITRISEIENSISEASKDTSKIKISIDKGDVFFVKFSGHDELDPQGTPVDRCARISKYLKPTTILSSFEYVKECPEGYLWEKIGEKNLKGIGITSIYQFAKNTILLQETIEIEKDKYDSILDHNNSLQREIENLTLENKNIKDKNNDLQKLFKEHSILLDNSLVIKKNQNEAQELWVEIDESLVKIKELITDADADSDDYARFIFLNHKGEDGQQYNAIENRKFDSCIDNNLVEKIEDDFFTINRDNKRNKKLLPLIEFTESLLLQYDEKYASDEILYDLSFSDPKFWEKYLKLNVL